MKFLLSICFLINSFVCLSQSGIMYGTYTTDIGDITITNDSVVTENMSYYIYHYSSQEHDELPITTYEMFSENKKHQLIIIYKNDLPKHLILSYKGYQEETFNVSFIPENKKAE